MPEIGGHHDPYRAFRRIARFAAPHGFVQMRRKRRISSGRPNYLVAQAHLDELDRAAVPFDYEDAIAFMQTLGVPEAHARGGSVSARSLEYVASVLRRSAADGGPTLGLHIGNYLGVSLAALAAAERDRHADSLVVAIDPNLPHRGTRHNQDRVCKLVDRYGVGGNVLLVCGYSGEKAPSNNGWIIEGYDPAERIEDEAAPHAALRNLGRLVPRAVDWALVDGNHDAEYLRADLASLARLVRSGGLVVLDDCTDSWPEIKRTFAEVAAEAEDWIATETDGRMGVLVRTASERDQNGIGFGNASSSSAR